MSRAVMITVMRPSAWPKVMLLGFVLLTPLHASGQGLDRLFLTPAERTYLERLRISSNQPQPEVVSEPQVEEPEVSLEPEEAVIYTHGGTMQRADGSVTVWLNGRAYSRNELPDNIELLSPVADGALRISDPESDRSFQLRPGQILNLTTGQVSESYRAPARDNTSPAQTPDSSSGNGQ